ncbi:MAG: ribonuclease III [Deltaproteobacteria bacterium]|nr:ribonuclease III [Deltaproteobacteria bacterium]
MSLVDPDHLARVNSLETRLGCSFAQPERALEALTHKSYVNESRGEACSDNERLEFLGDAVIDLAVSHKLMALCPDASEGKLSRLRASLVNEEGLARVARMHGLGELLRLGKGEERTGGRDKSSLLADALEAVLAAIFLEQGFSAVVAVVERLFGDLFERARDGTLEHDYKTELQERAQSVVHAQPRYRVTHEEGPDHAKTFEVEVVIGGETYGTGSGRNKKDAEQAAAKVALEKLAQPAQGS